MMELPVTKMSRIVMPASTNDAGNLYGGRLLDWMDEVSGIAAKRFAHSEVMTVGIESIRLCVLCLREALLISMQKLSM